MARSLTARPSVHLALAIALGGLGAITAAQAGPLRGGIGGPASGAGVLPGAGFGRPGLCR